MRKSKGAWILGEDRPWKTRLARADCSGPGLSRRRRGRGFEYLDESGARVDDAETLERDPGAGDSAGVGGRLDLPGRQRAYPGGRNRRRRAAAVPLPRRVAARARDREKFERMLDFAGALPQMRETVAEHLAPCRRPARARTGGRGSPARRRFLPHRRRVIRRGERDLRPRDAAQAARPRRSRRLAGLRLHREGRSAPPPAHRRSRGRASSSARLKRRRNGTELLAYKERGRWIDVRSPDVNDYIKAVAGGRLHGQGLPHLARDRARGGRRCPRLGGGPVADRTVAGGRAGSPARSPTTSATLLRSAVPRTSTRASSTATRTGSRSAARSSSSARAPTWASPATQGPVEEAVLDLLDRTDDSPAVERVC